MDKKAEIRWNLDDVLAVSRFEETVKEIRIDINKLEEYIKKLDATMSADKFKQIILFDEELGQKVSRIMSLPGLMEEADQKDQTAKSLKGRADEVYLAYEEKARKLSHWIKGLKIEDKKRLDEKNAKRLFASVPDLEFRLNYARKAAKYTLEEREERIVANKDINGIETLTDLRELIETEFCYELKVKGKKTKTVKTQAELMALTHSGEADIREAAYRAMLMKHQENLDKFFLIYRSRVKDWDFEAKIRGYGSPIGMRNFANHLPDKAVESLLEVCVENRGIFQNYFKYKAEELGVKKLRRYDIYAPLEKKERKVSFEEAKEMVMNTFGEFSERFTREAKKIFAEQHVDGLPRENKRGGAFCATIGPKITPFVLLNHTGRMRDVYTMAHELGHGVHSLYANKHLPSCQHANLPLSETASTLGEMILFEKMLAQENNRGIKKSLLSEKIGDSYATILRQNYFVLFENEVHEKMGSGIVGKDLGKMWLKGLKEQFGDSVEVDPIFAHEWSYIPHIVQTPFYCYAYSFGELLSLSLFARYKEEGRKFVPTIEKILETGGSRDPVTVLKEAGVDISSKDFWRQGFEVIKNWQENLTALK